MTVEKRRDVQALKGTKSNSNSGNQTYFSFQKAEQLHKFLVTYLSYPQAEK